MNSKTAKELDLIELLASLNFYPVKRIKYDVWFFSPFRNETTPSFKVCSKINKWFDHGEGKGGNTLDFMIKLKMCSISEALKLLESKSFSFHKPKKANNETTQNIEIVSERRIQKATLISYLHERKIDVSTARKYCIELHYLNIQKTNSNNAKKSKSDNRLKPFYTIAFKNDLGGYETRNKIFQSCLFVKAITTIKNDSNTLNLFEGFSDFLSYLTLMPHKENEDFIITNSTSIVKNTIEVLPNYTTVKTFFDNDESGIKATKLIQENCKREFLNESLKFKKYNDVNDYLMAYRR
ncbi:toprim domain-containing protein [Algibacter pectinivorans]|uniref:CHC2 zinc finger n=1 Tax=Algibacter pectinivorans TaxID=870482 RepID=A0A1I1RLM7_9FLAO|nr:toprim domain-containing protein [Algibacter pectinivorans]SFD35231.1 CHC2 zinc finger [Algibacter pectinivorans]